MSGLPVFDPWFSTPELTEIYSAESTVAAMLEFEAALAQALADAGIAPAAKAELVVSACRAGVADPEGVLASTWESGTPLIALKESVMAGIEEEARQWFHFGATSQDAIDTGSMIQAGRALEAIEAQLMSMAGRLRDLTVQYRTQPQAGRTFLQEARPTVFGFRTATWLDAVLNHTDELRRQRSALAIQLGGPVGTMSAYGEKASQVVFAAANSLGLKAPDISWHTDRNRVLSLAQAVGRVAATMAKIGSDIAILASSEIAEISVRSGGSSSMPEKQNPVDAIRAVATAKACAGAVAMVGSGTGHELDRGIGGWHVEWLGVPLAFQASAAAVESIERCLKSLEVDQERMSANAGADLPYMPPDQIDRVLAAYDRVLG